MTSDFKEEMMMRIFFGSLRQQISSCCLGKKSNTMKAFCQYNVDATEKEDGGGTDDDDDAGRGGDNDDII